MSETHRYWKFTNITAPGGRCAAAQLVVPATPGGSPQIPVIATSEQGTALNAFDGDIDYPIWETDLGQPFTITMDFGSPVHISEVSITSRTIAPQQCQWTDFGLSYSDDNITYTVWRAGLSFAAFGGPGETQTILFDFESAEFRVTYLTALTPFDGGAVFYATRATALALYNYPTSEIKTTMSRALVTYVKDHELRATKVEPLVVCLGRRALPNVRVWTFTLDGHEFLVINLQLETLVYDFHSERWSCWGTGDSRSWRVQRGITWLGNLGAIQAGLGGEGVSNIVVGDEETASLYFLKPEQPDDDSFDGTTKQKFQRILYGQITTRGNSYTDCPGIEVTASNGETTGARDNRVTLFYSDDKGHTMRNSGTLGTTEGELNVTLSWRSLGSFPGPGRLFKLVDYGITRIDSMELLDSE